MEPDNRQSFGKALENVEFCAARKSYIMECIVASWSVQSEKLLSNSPKDVDEKTFESLFILHKNIRLVFCSFWKATPILQLYISQQRSYHHHYLHCLHKFALPHHYFSSFYSQISCSMGFYCLCGWFIRPHNSHLHSFGHCRKYSTTCVICNVFFFFLLIICVFVAFQMCTFYNDAFFLWFL